jgi:hypothetical protein
VWRIFCHVKDILPCEGFPPCDGFSAMWRISGYVKDFLPCEEFFAVWRTFMNDFLPCEIFHEWLPVMWNIYKIVHRL